METEGGGSAAAAGAAVGLKRPRGGDDDSSSNSANSSDCDEWLVSDSGSEEEEDDDEIQGFDSSTTGSDYGHTVHFQLMSSQRVSYDHRGQSRLPYRNPETKLRGPSPAMLFPPFKNGDHVFGSDYNLGDKSEINVSNVGDCSDECDCFSMSLLQFIDLKIAGYQHNQPGRAKIFGFFAAWDTVEPLRNYVYRREVDNCESVHVKRKTGVAHLSLSSPTRVISMMSRAFIEFELHVLNEDEINGDESSLIIEGCTELHTRWAANSFIKHVRLYGERCALDIKYAVLIGAVEARVNIEVLTRALTCSMDLKIYAKTSGFGDVIRLFRGTLPQVGFRKNFAVAVKRHSYLDLYMEGCKEDDSARGNKLLPSSSWKHSFQSCFHGTLEDVVKLGDFATISVTVTWRSYEKRSVTQPKYPNESYTHHDHHPCIFEHLSWCF